MPLPPPSPDQIHPLKDHPRVVFIKNVITSPLIEAGDYSYYDDPVDPTGFERNVLHHYGPDRLIIKKFCAIATGVTFIMGGANHKMDAASTYPFPIMGGAWGEHMDLLMNLPNKGDTVIGNDVWIGHQALIMPGVTIGNGAIIAARSVVTDDVPAYAIVGGNPAMVIKRRFSDADIADLEVIEWWDWPVEVVTRHVRDLMTLNIEALKAVR